MSRRTERINAQLREEISDLLREDLDDPRIAGLVTVMHVDVSPDMRRATAYVSVLGTDEERASTLAGLASARPFFRRELGRRLHIKQVPDVDFVADTSLERAQELTDIMRRNASERGESL